MCIVNNQALESEGDAAKGRLSYPFLLLCNWERTGQGVTRVPKERPLNNSCCYSKRGLLHIETGSDSMLECRAYMDNAVVK